MGREEHETGLLFDENIAFRGGCKRPSLSEGKQFYTRQLVCMQVYVGELISMIFL